MSDAMTETSFMERGFTPNQFYGEAGVGVGTATTITNNNLLKSPPAATTTTTTVNSSSNTINIEPFATVIIFRGSSNNNNSNNTDTDVTDNKTRTLTTTPVIYCNMTDKYHREDERIKTFERWPLNWLDKNELAMTGMFYGGDADKVKCYFCEVEIGHWDLEDQPVSEHLRWSPNCPLLRRRTTNNVPINVEALDRLLPAQSYDVCGMNDNIDVRPHAYAEGTINMANLPPSLSHQDAATPAPIYSPVFREYAIEAARIRSFAEWPRHMKQKPERMAEAGFFYTGTGDRVKCFSCGGGLKDWDENDDPWEQHAIWLTNCRYLKLIKGQQFIDEAIAKQKANDAAEAAALVAASRAAADAAAAATPPAPAPAAAVAATAAAPVVAKDTTATTQTETFCANAVTAMCTMSTPTVVTALTDTTINNTSNTVTSTITQQPQASQTAASIVASVQEMNEAPSTSSAAPAKPLLQTPTSVPEEKLCKICYAGEYNTAFLPCGHVVACAKCASSVTKCPLCRKSFTDVMRVYFS